MFEIRKLRQSDYPELVKWWSANKFSAPAIEILPDNGESGLMISKGDVNIAACFLYTTNSVLVWIEFFVGNFEYREKDRKDAFRLLINTISEAAKKMGYHAAFTSLKNPHLIKYYEDCGYVKGSEGTTEMIRIL